MQNNVIKWTVFFSCLLLSFAITANAEIAKEQIEPVKSVSLNRLPNGDWHGSLKNVPLRDVLGRLSSVSALEFYLHPQVKKIITTEVANEDFAALVKRITMGLNTSKVWVPDENAPGKYKLSALYIYPSSTDASVFQFEVIGKSELPSSQSSSVTQSSQQTRVRDNGSASIYHPRPIGQPRPIIREEHDGVETAYVADELLIRINPGDNIDAVIRRLNRVVKSHHGVLAQRLHRLKYFLARFPQGTDVQALKEELKKNNFVAAAETNYLAKIAATQEVAIAAPWHLDRIHLPRDLDNDLDSDDPGPAIAILDTGVAHNILELQGRVNLVADLINSDDDPDDDQGHGTAMALLALQVAPKAIIHAVKVMNENGVGTYADLAEGIFRALDRHIDVINISLGGYAPSQILQDAIQYAHYKGAVVVAAVGNDGLIDHPFYPAAYANVIGVTALDRLNQPHPQANQGDFVDLAAPGTALSYTRDSQQQTIDGTSAAAALVAGATALVADERSRQLPGIIAGRLFEAAVDIAPDNKDQITGYGLVNLEAALQLSDPAATHEESFQPLPGIIPLDGEQLARIADIDTGEESGWLELDSKFENHPSSFCALTEVWQPGRIVIVKDDNGRFSVSAADFDCDTKKVQLYVLAGRVENLQIGDHESLNLVTGFMPSGAAGVNKFVDTDNYGIHATFIYGGLDYDGLEYIGTFDDDVQTYLNDHGAELRDQLKDIPSHLLYSPFDFFYNNQKARLEASGGPSLSCREGACRPLILIHGWQGADERWATTLLMQNEVGAWWDFAEQNNQTNLLYDNETLNLHPLYGVKEQGSEHLSYFEQNRTLQEQYKVYLFRYPTMRSNEYNAIQLAELINTHPELKDRTDLVLMGHSTGGLLAKYVTLGTDAVPTLNNRIDGVITLATPHRGSISGDDYDMDFDYSLDLGDADPDVGEDIATCLDAPLGLKHAIAAGQDIAGFNLQTDGAVDLAWDGAWSDGDIPCINQGEGAGQYAPNSKLAELNTTLLADPSTLAKFRFYGGWIETDAFVDMVEAAGRSIIEETIKGVAEAVATGGVSVGKAVVNIGLSASTAYFAGEKGPNDNSNSQIVSAGALSYLGLDTDSVVSLPSSLLLAPEKGFSEIDLPAIPSKLFSISGNRRIFYDRDHSQMREPVDKNAIKSDLLFNIIDRDLNAFATPVPPKITVNPDNYYGAGHYDKGTQVVITSDVPVKIYYTLDGSEPTTTSTVDDNPLTLTLDQYYTEIRYFAMDGIGTRSALQSRYYFLHDPELTPSLYIKVARDPADLVFNDRDGSVKLIEGETVSLGKIEAGTNTATSLGVGADPVVAIRDIETGKVYRRPGTVNGEGMVEFTSFDTGRYEVISVLDGNTIVGSSDEWDRDVTLSRSKSLADEIGPYVVGGVDIVDIRGMTVSGDYAYVADGVYGLKVIDISNPQSPARVGLLNTDGTAFEVTVSGNYAYVADGVYGLKIINISNPQSPVLVGSIDTSNALGVSVSGNYAYVADYTAGLKIIDISNLQSPVLVGSLETTKALGVTVSGNYAYVADDYRGLKIIDISNPQSPVLAGSLKTGRLHINGDANGVTVSGNYAYVADGGYGLKIINISNPQSPVLVGSIDTSNALGVSVSGNYAYVADMDAGLKIIDISNPQSPVLVGRLKADGSAFEVTVFGNYAYVADHGVGPGPGLKVIDISNPQSSALVGSLDLDGSARGVSVFGNYAYVADMDAGLKIIDISNPPSPVLVGSISTRNALGVSVSDNYAYVADGDEGLKIIDISNPQSPVLVGSIDTSLALGVSVSGNYAYVADYTAGLKIIDISSPQSPVLVGSLNTYCAHEVIVSGNYAYVADGDEGLKIIDISNPQSPVLVGSIDTDNALGVSVSGNYAYVADQFSGLKIIDISNLQSPVLVGSIGARQAFEVTVSGNYAYVADSFYGLKIIDISNPQSPGLVDNIDTAYGVTVFGNYAYVAADHAGLTIIDIEKTIHRTQLLNAYYAGSNFNNHPPEFSRAQLSQASGVTNQTIDLPILASDPDGESLTYTVSTGTVDTNGIWSAVFSQGGIYQVTINVSDSYESISKTITVVVMDNGEIANFFTDVPYAESGPNTSYAAIHYLALNGIVIGYDNGSGGREYRPDAQVNQAEALKMIMLAANNLGIIEFNSGDRYLPNLVIEMMDNGNYYYRNYTWAAPFILKAEELGIIEDAGAFDPEASLTREWAARVVRGILGLAAPDELKGEDYLFTDSASFTSMSGYDAARNAALFGYFSGLGSSFNPATTMTRSDLAILASKILRTPQFGDINISGTAEQTVDGRLLPALNLGNSLTITGLADVNHYKILQTLATIKHEWIDTPDEYLNVEVFRQGETNGAIRLLQNLTTIPITVATNDLNLHNEQIRSLLVVLEDPYSGVRTVKRLEYGILFPDRDNDGIPDNEDLWPDDSRYHTDANNNDIPDMADSIWELGDVQGDTVLPYGNGNTTYIDVLLAGDFSGIDSDGDGINNTTDPDDDNDGIPDQNDILPLDPIFRGDMNNDGSINLMDAIIASQVMCGSLPASTIFIEAEVNGGARIGLEEMIYILQKVSGVRP